MGYHHLRRLASAFSVLAAALCVVVVVPAMHEGGRCVAEAARPLMEEGEEAVMMDVDAAAESPEGARWGDGDGVVRAGKWLPLPLPLPAARSALAAGLRFPAAGVSMPWIAGAPPALAGLGLQLLPPPYVGVTRQEQLSLWASLFHPFQVRPRQLPVAAAAETTSPAEPVDIPAIPGVGQKRTTVDEHAGEPKWGVFLGSINGN
ncbi:hypothetical protein GUJ93_ZPchr0012g19207 [Zizania palustris]|uniref:Uncharacterized protein n=1 Tax=Zizania palustris TaxID=103762 RepID=A0A8J5WQT7_ZIZPA|nr:hypothetical protein GUJ93_ZPchr0012g19207 [Zizania palustris]